MAPARTRGSLWRASTTLILAGLAVLGLVLGPAVGPAGIPLGDVVDAILGGLGLPAGEVSPITRAIVWDLRLPGTVTAAAIGAILGMCGAVMQAVTRNDLADPYLLGLSSGATVGAVTAFLAGASLLMPVGAFVGALAALALTLTIAHAGGRASNASIILAGIAVSALAAAVTSLLIFRAGSSNAYQEIIGWLLGSIQANGWPGAGLAVAALLVFGPPVLASSRLLDGFGLGDLTMESLGIPAGVVRLAFLCAVSLLTAIAVSLSGAIGFIGLVMPHIARLLVGRGNAAVLPYSALLGAIFLTYAEVASRTLVQPEQIPVGVITALAGAPVFGLLLIRAQFVRAR